MHFQSRLCDHHLWSSWTQQQAHFHLS